MTGCLIRAQKPRNTRISCKGQAIYKISRVKGLTLQAGARGAAARTSLYGSGRLTRTKNTDPAQCSPSIPAEHLEVSVGVHICMYTHTHTYGARRKENSLPPPIGHGHNSVDKFS